MNLGLLKEKVFSMLDLRREDATTEGSFSAAVERKVSMALDHAARKTALYTCAIVKTAQLTFQTTEAGDTAALPSDFLGVKRLVCGGEVYGRERYETVGHVLYLFGLPATGATLFYFAYPDAISDSDSDEKDMPFDDYLADTIAYGAASSICPDVYPTDMERYMRLSTEYDERILNPGPDARSCFMRDGFFSVRRGLFR